MNSHYHKHSHYQVKPNKPRKRRPKHKPKRQDSNEKTPSRPTKTHRSQKNQHPEYHHIHKKHGRGTFKRQGSRFYDFYHEPRDRKHEERRNKRRKTDFKYYYREDVRGKRSSRGDYKCRNRNRKGNDWKDARGEEYFRKNRQQRRRHTYAVGLKKNTLDQIFQNKAAFNQMEKLQKVFKNQNDKKKVNSQTDNKFDDENNFNKKLNFSRSKELKKMNLSFGSQNNSESEDEILEQDEFGRINLFDEIPKSKSEKKIRQKLVIDLSELRKQKNLSANTTQGSINDCKSLSHSSSINSLENSDDDYDFIMNALEKSKREISNMKTPQNKSALENLLQNNFSDISFDSNNEFFDQNNLTNLQITQKNSNIMPIFEIVSNKTKYFLEPEFSILNSNQNNSEILNLEDLNFEPEIEKSNPEVDQSEIENLDINLKNLLAQKEVEDFEKEESKFLQKIKPIIQEIDKERKERREKLNLIYKQRKTQMLKFYSLLAQREEYNSQVDLLLLNKSDSEKIMVDQKEFRIKSQFQNEDLKTAKISKPTNPFISKSEDSVSTQNCSSSQNEIESDSKQKSFIREDEIKKPKKIIVLKKCKKFFKYGSCPKGSRCKHLHIKNYKKYQNLLDSVNNHVICRLKKGECSLPAILNCFDKLHPSLEIFSKFMYRKPEISVFDEIFDSESDQNRIH